MLKALNREKEITPRLEAAARRDSKNVPLQYVLADRYRETGENDKAEALYKSLLSSQPTPQTYRALANSLLKRKKAADFLKVMSEALKRPESLDAIKPQLAAAAADDEMAEAMLDAGLKQIAAGAGRRCRSRLTTVLSLIANNPGQNSRNKNRRLEKLLAHRAVLRRAEPQPDRPERDRRHAEAVGSSMPNRPARVEKLIARVSRRRSRFSGWSFWPISIAGPATTRPSSRFCARRCGSTPATAPPRRISRRS